MSFCKDKEFKGEDGKAEANPADLLTFKRLYMIAEDLLDDRDPREAKSGAGLSADMAMTRSFPLLKLPESIQ